MPLPNSRLEFEHNIALIFEKGLQKAESGDEKQIDNNEVLKSAFK